MQSPHHAWILRLREQANARGRLLCLPHAGGGTVAYRAWAPLLPEFEVWAVALPGREHRFGEPLATTLPEIVHPIADALTTGSFSDRPLTIFGHSMGAVVAFELARELSRRRVPLHHLIVSGCRAPDELEPLPVHALPEADFRRALRELGGTPPEVLAHDELMALLGPILRADFRVLAEHRHLSAAPLTVPITALAGEDDRRADPATMRAWKRHTSGPFELHPFPGGHFFLEPERDAVLSIVRRLAAG